MFFQAGGDGQNVRIEDDVIRWKRDLFGQKFVSARADVDLALKIVGLTLLVERHHDRSGAVASD